MMKHVLLKKFIVRSAEFVNNVEGSMQLKLKNSTNFHVDYNDAEGKCRSRMVLEIAEETNPTLLRVKLEIWGYFKITNMTDKAQIHVETYDELFPQARAYIASLTAMAGVSPIMAVPINLVPEGVKVKKPETPEEPTGGLKN